MRKEIFLGFTEDSKVLREQGNSRMQKVKTSFHIRELIFKVISVIIEADSIWGRNDSFYLQESGKFSWRVRN